MTILPIYQDMKWNCANFCVISREIAKIIWIRFKLGFSTCITEVKYDSVKCKKFILNVNFLWKWPIMNFLT